MTETFSFDFSKRETLTAALALKEHATETYCDDRLALASAEYRIAARLFFAAGYNAKADTCRAIAAAIDSEALTIAAGAEDEADDIATTIRNLQRGG